MIKSIGKLIATAFGSGEKGGNVFHPSEKCPDCGTRLFKGHGWGERPREPLAVTHDGSRGRSPHQSTEWRCPNLDCPAKIRANIEHWCSPGAMDIPGADAAFVAVLTGRGLVRDVAEIYRLKAKELAALPGIDKDSAQKFFDAITASMKRDAWCVLFGLNIPLLGADEAKSLCRHFPTLDHIFGASVEQLMEAHGIGEVVPESVVYWYGDSVNRKIVKRLFKAGVNFKSQL